MEKLKGTEHDDTEEIVPPQVETGPEVHTPETQTGPEVQTGPQVEEGTAKIIIEYNKINT